MSERVAVIAAGRMRQVGSVRQIKAGPADEVVAAFLHELPHEPMI
jgi:ABC-type Fe3+/spermidine/putrescine transport system ATPase subunit